MSTRFVMLGTVSRVEERFAKRWVKGLGAEAVFDQISEGWYVQLKEAPMSIVYLGSTDPQLKEGDRVRMTLEKL